MARHSVPADRQKAPRKRGPLASALSAAVFSLATVAAPTAAAQAPAPGNGTAIFSSYHVDANGTYVDANGNPLPLDANGHPIDPATGRPIDPATGQPTPADPPPAPAEAPAPAAAPAPGTTPAGSDSPGDDSDGKGHEQLGAVEPVSPKKKPHHSTPTNHGDRRNRHQHRHRQDRPHAAPPTPDTNQPTAPPNPGPQPTLASAPPKQHVPDLVLERFNIPPFLLPVYQAAAVSYNVPWTVLAAINSVETDYGRNTNVSSAGALGWMQFMPATWRMYGVDANLDGKRDPYNPADAIFAAARYLNAAGADKDVRRAVYAYNHADWYVDMVMERAKALSKIPADVVDSLTGLAQARMPIPGKLKVEHKLGPRKWTKLQATTGRRVVAAADGRIVSMGIDDKLGRFVVLEDAYGNRFTYAHLGSLALRYAVPKKHTVTKAQVARELHLPHHDPHPSRPATQGHPTRGHDRVSATAKPKAKRTVAPEPTLANDMLLLRRGRMAGAVTAGERAIAAHAIGLKPDQVTLRTLHKGSRVVAGTILGHVAYGSRGKGAPVRFAVRPGGHDAPRVDARPLLKGWRLLQSTAVYGPAGTSTLNPTHGRVGLGQALLMGKEALGRRVLNDPRIQIYDCGGQDIEAGQIDRRVLAVLEFLADSGFHPTVTALECGHSLMTASGNISEHSTGDAVDIAAINGIPIVGHQGPGSITDTVVRRLLELQGTMKPHQIITLMSYPGTDNTLALADHYDHIHVGFHPEAGAGSPSVTSALEPEQWSKFMSRLRTIDNPQVSTHVSRFAIPAKPAA